MSAPIRGPADRISAIQAPVIPIVAAMVRDTPGTISLGQGVVHYGPPPEAGAELARFWADPMNHRYGLVDGTPELRAALADKLAAENGTTLGPERDLLVTAGGNMAFLHAVLAITDPGDEIILPTPYYFNHRMAVEIAGCRTVAVPTDTDFQLELDAIRAAITPRTRAVVTVSPNNPTGAVYDEASLRAVNALCAEAGIHHISDEAYEYFLYDGATHFSPASIPGSEPHTIALYSLSKAYGFASWRIGYMVIPSALRDATHKIQDTNLICPPLVSQFAALGALRAGVDYCLAGRAVIERSRAELRGALNAVGGGCRVAPADGALYYLVELRTERTDLEVVERLIRDHRVAAMPGSAFGLDGCHLRLSFGALDADSVREAAGRLVAGLRTLI